MNSGKRKSILPYIPGYDNNAVLKLIFFVAGSYMALALTWCVFMMVNITPDSFNTHMIPNLSLPHVSMIGEKWWTIFTYGIFQVPNSFMNVISNMLWLYCFGSVVQMLIGKEQIVPLFVYSLLCGGVFYLAAQYLPGELGKCPPYIMGPRAGLAGMCAAAVTISPKYRFYLSETFSVPMLAVAGIFTVLMILGSGYYVPVVAMIAGGGVMGYGYVRLLKSGYRPGAWIYSIRNTLASLVTPNDKEIARKKGQGIYAENPKQQTKKDAERRVDEILDKINRKGYNSLSEEEKNFLKKASQE